MKHICAWYTYTNIFLIFESGWIAINLCPTLLSIIAVEELSHSEVTTAVAAAVLDSKNQLISLKDQLLAEKNPAQTQPSQTNRATGDHFCVQRCHYIWQPQWQMACHGHPKNWWWETVHNSEYQQSDRNIRRPTLQFQEVQKLLYIPIISKSRNRHRRVEVQEGQITSKRKDEIQPTKTSDLYRSFLSWPLWLIIIVCVS